MSKVHEHREEMATLLAERDALKERQKAISKRLNYLRVALHRSKGYDPELIPDYLPEQPSQVTKPVPKDPFGNL